MSSGAGAREYCALRRRPINISGHSSIGDDLFAGDHHPSADLRQGESVRLPEVSLARPVGYQTMIISHCSVLIVDECRLLCDVLIDALRGRSWVKSVSGACNLAEAVEAGSVEAPGIVLLSMHNVNPAEFVGSLRENFGEIPIIATSMAETEEKIIFCAELGVAGMLPMTGTLEDLELIVGSVLRGDTACSTKVAGVLLRRVTALTVPESQPPANREERLTPREREVLTLIELGWSNKQIAHELCIEVRTVKNHVHNLLEKLRVTRRGEAAARARSGNTSGQARPKAAEVPGLSLGRG